MLSLLEQLEDSLGISLLGFGGILGDDLKVDTVLAHQSNGQTGKGAAEEDEEYGGDIEDPKLGAFLLFVAIVQLFEDADGRGRGTDGEESFGESQDGWAKRHQGMAMVRAWLSHDWEGVVGGW